MAAGEEVCGFAQRAAELAQQAANVSRAVNGLLWQQVCGRMRTYADVCGRMLTSADVCGRMLTYAAGCSGSRALSQTYADVC
jgi:hypothetical protein